MDKRYKCSNRREDGYCGLADIPCAHPINELNCSEYDGVIS